MDMFLYGDNFGQRLQNLAVQEVIKRFGFEVYTIPQVIPETYRVLYDERHKFFEKYDSDFIKYYPDSIGNNKIPDGLEDFRYFVTGSDQVWSP